MPNPTNVESLAPAGTNRRSRWVIALTVLGLLIVLSIVGLPWIVSNTSILNGLLRSGLAGYEIEASIGDARLGWLTPASLYDIQLKDRQQRWSLDADRASTQLTLLQLLWSRGDLGEFKINSPTLVVNADRPWPEMPKEEPEPADGQLKGAARLRVSIENGRVLVRTTAEGEPDEFVSGANLVVDYQQDHNQRTVVIHRGKPVERVQLTKEMCDLGLKFVLPILADVTWVRGSLSLELDRCVISLGDPQRTEVNGRLYIHSIESGLRQDWVQGVVAAATALGDVTLPESVRLADESVVAFNVSEGRVEHQNLQFGLPEISPKLVITTSGTVGFDQTLDLVAELPPLGDWMGDGIVGQAMRAGNLELSVKGTLDQPQAQLRGGEQILDALVEPLVGPLSDGDLTDEDLQKAIEEIGGTIGDLLQRAREQRQERLQRREEEGKPPGPFQRMRERRRARQLPR